MAWFHACSYDSPVGLVVAPKNHHAHVCTGLDPGRACDSLLMPCPHEVEVGRWSLIQECHLTGSVLVPGPP